MPVYFVRAGEDGPVKIGWAKNDARERLRQLQTNHFMELRLIRTVKDSVRTDEVCFHQYFADARIKGEWYDYSDTMITVEVDQVRNGRLPPPITEVIESDILREGRRELDLPQHVFARLIGTSASYLCHMEHGRRPITLELLARMPKPIRDKLIDARMAALEKIR